jgi:hypothetical protein
MRLLLLGMHRKTWILCLRLAGLAAGLWALHDLIVQHNSF